jgi:hypothetical protein
MTDGEERVRVCLRKTALVLNDALLNVINLTALCARVHKAPKRMDYVFVDL